MLALTSDMSAAQNAAAGPDSGRKKPTAPPPSAAVALRSPFPASLPMMTAAETLRRIHLLELLQEEADAEASSVAPLLPDDAAETWCAGREDHSLGG